MSDFSLLIGAKGALRSPTRLRGLLTDSPMIWALSHPIALAALATLAVNDHLLKARFGNAVTGKLSDVAGMIFFPLLFASLVELALRLVRVSVSYRRLLIGSVVSVALVFAGINLSSSVGAVYSDILGGLQWPFRVVLEGSSVPFVPAEHVVDPSDALAAFATAIAFALGSSAIAQKLSVAVAE